MREGGKNKKILILLFLAGWLLRLSYLFLRGDRFVCNWEDGWNPMAQNFLKGNGFCMTGRLGGGPGQVCYAFRGPVFLTFLVINYLFFGNNNFLATKIMVCLINALTIFFVYDIAKRIFGEKIGFSSAGIFAIFPTFIYFCGVSAPDILGTFFLALTIFLLLRGSEGNGSCLINIGSGIALGLTILSRSAYATFLPFVLIWQISFTSSLYRWKKSAITLLFALLAMIPWVGRNYRLTHTFVPLTTNGGWVFLQANNPYINDRIRGDLFPTEIPTIREKLKGMSEVKADSYLRQKAFFYIRKDPFLYCQRALSRFGRFWAPFPHKKYYSFSYWLGSSFIYIPLFLLAFIGALFAKEKQKVCSLFYFLFLSQTIVNMATRACIRYRLPLEPYLIILATSGFYALKERLKWQRKY